MPAVFFTTRKAANAGKLKREEVVKSKIVDVNGHTTYGFVRRLKR